MQQPSHAHSSEYINIELQSYGSGTVDRGDDLAFVDRFVGDACAQRIRFGQEDRS
jgi:hypothetical protein